MPSSLTKILKLLFLTALALSVSWNFFALLNHQHQQVALRAKVPFYFQGLKFGGLEDIFQDVTAVGYFSDMNITEPAAAAQYAQAQYVLAPIILDLDYAQHEYILTNCRDPRKALAKMQELGTVPLRRNQFDIMLFKKSL